jgi:hypothetical protein
MTLAHYTSIFSLGGIVQDGISIGEVPVTPIHVVNFPWFTSEFSQDGQEDWVGRCRSKLDLRLEVEFRDNDQRLVRWREYAKRLRVRDDCYEKLTKPRMAINGRNWFVYRGVVPFEWITVAYFHPCHERVSPADLRRAAEIIAPLNIPFTRVLPCRHLTEEEALTLSHDERTTGHSTPVLAALSDFAAHRKSRVFRPPRVTSFLEYVQGAADIYRDARLGDDISRNCNRIT